jgi:hypothetical protein
MVAVLESINESCRDAEIRTQCEDALQRLSETIEHLTRENEWQEATRLVGLTLKRIDETEPSARQRNFKKQFLQRFGRFLVAGMDGRVGGESGGVIGDGTSSNPS